ncbi:EscU/YscU/HrcU family type III secretion system export apparatus switch protein [Oceanobacillus sp. Castelsardo]|uniref:EscU/YscU/HrcU family type III secretion system export apparatus switch protein n=1 Tax=Oceanobacillus sp. Castelsardo TaxID=1851204 RepID=UPI000838D736|nr:EscU/YscU/HrcU family type III secretion system export apparatus switch protein [Oceanobacillus sp. Castelsardo]
MTNKKAVSLKYNQKKNPAPVVTAVGKGKTADEILEIASQNQIPIVEDIALVELLSKLNINEVIPEELYEAVAEVFAFIYNTEQSIKQNK